MSNKKFVIVHSEKGLERYVTENNKLTWIPSNAKTFEDKHKADSYIASYNLFNCHVDEITVDHT